MSATPANGRDACRWRITTIKKPHLALVTDLALEQQDQLAAATSLQRKLISKVAQRIGLTFLRTFPCASTDCHARALYA
jgi:hypothetical protein